VELSEVCPGVWELRLPIPWEDGHVNCFLLPEGHQVDMVDCGMSAQESFDLIHGAVRHVGGPKARLRRLLVEMATTIAATPRTRTWRTGSR